MHDFDHSTWEVQTSFISMSSRRPWSTELVLEKSWDFYTGKPCLKKIRNKKLKNHRMCYTSSLSLLCTTALSLFSSFFPSLNKFFRIFFSSVCFVAIPHICSSLHGYFEHSPQIVLLVTPGKLAAIFVT